MKAGIEVYGFDSDKKDPGRIQDGADYILQTKGDYNIILTGGFHVNYWRDYVGRSDSDNIPALLVSKGVNGDDILTVANFQVDKAQQLKLNKRLYALEELPVSLDPYFKVNKVADYVIDDVEPKLIG